MSVKKVLRAALFVLGGAFLAIQFVPSGRAHDKPPVLVEPPWDSPETRAAFMRSCADCHSNETKWPWYSHVAPVSWLVEQDVLEARRRFNVSEWGRQRNDGDEAVEEVEEGKMPLPLYLRMHPEARLDGAERDAFLRGLSATFGVRARRIAR